MSIEAMKQALEALDVATTPLAKDRQEVLRAKEALRQVIAEAEKQEPVACKHKRYSVDVKEQTGTCYDCGAEGRMQFVVDGTRPQPADEPVGEVLNERGEVDYISYVPPAGTSLYTHPQPAAWVGLTDTEIDEIMRPLTQNQPFSWRAFGHAIARRLKEKNT